MMPRVGSTEEFIELHHNWKPLLESLREILLSADLEETIKWNMPAYITNGKNIIGLGAFKHFVTLWFHHGCFLTDPDNVLLNAQEGKTKGMRQWRFKEQNDIKKKIILKYVLEAKENSHNGLEVKPNAKKPIVIPSELQIALNNNKELQLKFNKFADYKKREFAEYISEAKRESTKIKRLEKITAMIINDIGLGDKYRK